MKNTTRLILGIVAIILTLLLGFELGKNYVIYNASVTNQEHEEGTYQLIIDDEIHSYWWKNTKGMN